jgi:DNA-directed RNA polymerase specialized sigma24 family protein
VPDISSAVPHPDRTSAERRFVTLFDTYHRVVLGYALRRVDEPADAAFDVSSERALTVRQALATLPEKDREVLLLAAWEGLTPRQIAVVTESGSVTVRSRLPRARRRLRAALDDDAGAIPAPRHLDSQETIT